jgi:hypothetical protein
MRRIALAAVPLTVLAAVLALSARGGPERSQLRIVRVASGLTEPIAVTAPRNEPNNVYVAEKVGRVRVIVHGRLRARPFLDIRSLVLDNGEQGLLGLAFSPKYAKDRHFYVDYTDRNGDARIVEYKSRGLSRKPRKLRQIFFQDDPYPNHNGGNLAFGPDDKILASGLDHHLYCIDPKDGSLIWDYEAGFEIDGSTIVSDGRVYFGCEDHNFYCLNLADGKLIIVNSFDMKFPI